MDIFIYQSQKLIWDTASPRCEAKSWQMCYKCLAWQDGTQCPEPHSTALLQRSQRQKQEN